MSNQSFAEPPRDERGVSASADLAFGLAHILENAKFDLESDREKARSSIAKVSSLLGLGLSPDLRFTGESKSKGGLAGWQARKIEQFIDIEIGNNVSVAHLSQLLDISPSHFARSFKITFKESPHAFIRRRRVTRAKHLLGFTALPLQDVALSCGFSDQSHLCHSFKKLVGLTPSNWRKYIRQEISSRHNQITECEP